MEDCLKLIVPIFNIESDDLIEGFKLIAEEPENADKNKIAFTLSTGNDIYNFEILKEDLETIIKFYSN